MRRITYLFILSSTFLLQLGCVSSDDATEDNSVENTGSDSVDDTNNETETGTDDTGVSSGAVRYLGMVGVIESTTGSSSPVVTAIANFLEYEDSFDIAESASSPFDSVLGTCEITNDSSNDTSQIPQPEPESDIKSNRVDAGGGIKITSGGDEYLDILRITFADNSVIYGSMEDSQAMADNLELTIPGNDQFPAFVDVPIATVKPVSLDSPSNSTVRFDTKFSWVAEGNSDAVVLLSASAFATGVDCFVEDNGSFEFPEDIQNELGIGFFGNNLETTRLSYKIEFRDDAALVVYSMSNMTQ